MSTQNQSAYSGPRITRRLLTSLVAVALVAVGAPATPILGGPGGAIASQGSGGGGGP